jgi:hypothetical protein
MSERKKNNPGYVTTSECLTRHSELTVQISNLQKDLTKVINTLMGEETSGSLKRKGGLVSDVQEIKERTKSRLSGKDKAAIAVALIMAAASIISRWI